LRDIDKCELFSKLVGGEIPCQHRVKELGFVECAKEMKTLTWWSLQRTKCWETELQGKKGR
jgi:hypothetical protein